MSEWVVDTNVPIVANGGAPEDGGTLPSLSCRQAAVAFLMRLVSSERVLLDQAGAIQTEYRSYLNPAGQPGVGDRFYQVILHSSPDRVRRVDLPRRADGEYESLPALLEEIGFDPSDRKFAALAVQEGAPIANATDSDWVNDAAALLESGLEVTHLCGCDMDTWFAT